jgi:abortive infection bacteriophage resistance protein
MSAVLKPSLDTLREIAVEEHTNDVEEFASWLESASDEREFCAHFGPISTPELVRSVILNQKANDVQLAEACKVLRRRFIEDYAPAIAKRTLELEQL